MYDASGATSRWPAGDLYKLGQTHVHVYIYICVSVQIVYMFSTK